MTMVAQRKQMTVAEFMALPDDGNRHEFVRGRVQTMPPPKGGHGRIEFRVGMAIQRYLDQQAMAHGWSPDGDPDARDRLVGFTAGGEFGMQFTLPDDPHQIRGADVAYVPAEQFKGSGWDGTSYFPEVPHLVVEIISSSDSAADVNEKVQDYLAGGARRVWCIYPEKGTVHIHDVEAPTRVLHRGDTLIDDELLPGFALPLMHIVPAPTSGESD
jgi:Uma2 family endonuclease